MSDELAPAKEQIAAIRRKLVDLIIDRGVSTFTEDRGDLILRTQDALDAIDWAFDGELRKRQPSPALAAAIEKINKRAHGT